MSDKTIEEMQAEVERVMMALRMRQVEDIERLYAAYAAGETMPMTFDEWLDIRMGRRSGCQP